MRPTNLNFRSPKQSTPSGYFPTLKNDGRRLSLGEVPKRSTFGSSKRFGSFDAQNRYRVGPGSYQNDKSKIGTARIIGGHQYKQFHGQKETRNNSYYFIGNHMVYDPNFPKPRLNSQGQLRIDTSVLSTHTSPYGSNRRSQKHPFCMKTKEVTPQKKEGVRRVFKKMGQ